VDTPG